MPTPRNLTVRILDGSGSPIPDIPVLFMLVDKRGRPAYDINEDGVFTTMLEPVKGHTDADGYFTGSVMPNQGTFLDTFWRCIARDHAENVVFDDARKMVDADTTWQQLIDDPGENPTFTLSAAVSAGKAEAALAAIEAITHLPSPTGQIDGRFLKTENGTIVYTNQPTGPSDGEDGWSQILAAVADGDRLVLQVVGWVGGSGTVPATGQYIGPVGHVATAAEAVNVKGVKGDKGDIPIHLGDEPPSDTSLVWLDTSGV